MYHRTNSPGNQRLRWKGFFCAVLTLGLLAGCTRVPATPTPYPTSTTRPSDRALSEAEIATLSSLEQLDDFPLYTLHYQGAYPQTSLAATRPGLAVTTGLVTATACQESWGCALFAALGDPGLRLYGRNFDWRFSPAVLLFTDPPDGYASVSLVDIEYLGFKGSRAKNLTSLPLSERQGLLDAPALPADGMNERGLAIGMAAVPPGEMIPDPDKKTIDQLGVMREILDHAGTIDEAVHILDSYNIEMGNVPLHYLVASAAGEAALVEFYQGQMVVYRNEDPWQLATNFLVTATGGHTQGQCYRFDRISQRLQEREGQFTIQEAFKLLADVSQEDPQDQSDTQWSVVYDMTGRTANIVMGRKYNSGAHTLQLNVSGR